MFFSRCFLRIILFAGVFIFTPVSYSMFNTAFWAKKVLNVVLQNSWTAMSTTNQPTSRSYAVTVWTGSKMVVWGGTSTDGNSTYYNTGGIYDPDANTWTATSTTGAPAARATASAVWTGSKMIVWGGGIGNSSPPFNTGGVYDPSTNTWTTMSTTNAPAARAGSAAVWTGSKMLIWGGNSTNAGTTTYFSDGAFYDPSTNTWTAMSASGAPAARTAPSHILVGSKMYVWGGDSSGATTNTGGIYDISTNTWVTMSTVNAPSPRYDASMVSIGSKIIVWGGWDTLFSALNTGGVYDPSTNSWTATSTTNAPAGRYGHGVASTGTLMLVWGGGTLLEFFNTGGLYDPSTNTWTAMTTVGAPAAIFIGSYAWTGTKFIAWDGKGPGGIYQ